jgi:hypothetical protein
MTGNTSGVRGAFNHESLTSAIQFASNHGPGRLELTSGARRATLWVANRHMIAAQCIVDGRELLGEDAIVELLSWQFGEFAMTPDSSPTTSLRGRVNKTLDGTLLAASVKRDTLDSELQTHLRLRNAIPVLAPAASGNMVQLEASVWTLMPKLNGVSTVADIAAQLGLDFEETCRRVNILEGAGLIRFERRVTPLPNGFLPALSTLVVQLAGPIGTLMLEDAAIAAELDLETMSADNASTLLHFLEREMPADRAMAFRNGAQQLLKHYRLS